MDSSQNYNCQNAADSSYGAGNYGTCATSANSTTGSTTAATTTQPGAPNTGFLQQLYDGGAFTIIAPLVIAVVLVLISTIVVRSKKHRSQP